MALVSADVGWMPNLRSSPSKPKDTIELTFTAAKYGILQKLNRFVLGTEN